MDGCRDVSQFKRSCTCYDEMGSTNIVGESDREVEEATRHKREAIDDVATDKLAQATEQERTNP